VVEKIDLAEIPESDFSLPPYGDLPLGALRRTRGAVPNEVLISVNFGISCDATGLDALEFIAWWVRDSARGGSPIQIRALALPPIGDQFGTTLRFAIDYFYVDPDEDIGKLIAKVGELADGLGGAIAMNAQVIGR
jgi:hypothetical protein